MIIRKHSGDSEFVAIGDFAPPEADRLLKALEAAEIPFEIECDDGISEGPNTSGTFGTRAYVSVFVIPSRRGAAERIRTELFGDSYDQT